jgi:uncharacterized damage-inducible protein DinB
MFISIDQFINEWTHEAEGTLKYLNVLTDDSLDQAIEEDHFSLGELAWHVTTAAKEIVSQSGLKIDLTIQGEMPGSAKEIAETYNKVSNAIVEAAKAQWNDESLKEMKNCFGFDMPVFAILRMTLNHQIHHRGQMTVLMRQAGLVVPGIYGPSREEWAKMKK